MLYREIISVCSEIGDENNDDDDDEIKVSSGGQKLYN